LIYFNDIRWKNFLSTGNTFTEVKLNKEQTTLIVGENGAGKSTLLDALSFVLYGKPFRKINKPQLLNSINKKDLVVEIEFSIGPGLYKVIRGIKPAVFEVYKNGNLLNQSATERDYQEILEKQILKLNHKSFCQVVVLGSASFVPFMQLTAQARREVIEDLLDIQIFSTMNLLLKQRVSTNNTSLLLIDKESEMTSEKIKMQQSYNEAMQKNIDEQLSKLRSDLRAISEQIDQEKSLADDYDEKMQKLTQEIIDAEAVEKKQSKVVLYERNLQAKIDRLREEIKFLENHDDCPTCQQLIDRAFKSTTIDTKLHSCAETEQGLVQLKEEADKVNARLAEIRNINSTITDLSIKRITHTNTVKGLIAQGKKIAKDIEEVQQKSTGMADASALIELEKLFEEQVEQKSELLKDRDAYSAATVILKDTGIKARIIKQYIPIINKLINKYLAAMDFFVMFELDENFNETIKSRFRDDFSYASFSEGEKMRINLAILFTWRAIAKLRNSASTNVLILDEVLDGSLDSNGTDEFLKILNNLTIDTNTYIISHKVDQMHDKFNSVIRFEKHKNFSRIVS
jgi:DNA repair exonuclease SbcCD ATPase subunit